MAVTWYDERCIKVGFDVKYGKRLGCAHREEAGDGVVDRIGLRPSIVDEVEVDHWRIRGSMTSMVSRIINSVA